ncbi:hypothetical protein NDU88_008170 [Pleurodeles waltl]|uniref:Uncharacterized protein n=1 Tax=Pleurodeles waltl TaxID=8319 RepID=A0AAV7VVV6_PLEWA|nr:hypothetical protein NDU88_008170 [Pleurodeles waltl]
MPVCEEERCEDEATKDGDPEAAGEKSSPGELEGATKSRKKEVGKQIWQSVDALKSQTGGRTPEEPMDPENREDEVRLASRLPDLENASEKDIDFCVSNLKLLQIYVTHTAYYKKMPCITQ